MFLTILISCVTLSQDLDNDLDGFSINQGDCNDNNAELNPADADADVQSTCEGDCDDTDATLTTNDSDGDGESSCDGDCDDTCNGDDQGHVIIGEGGR